MAHRILIDSENIGSNASPWLQFRDDDGKRRTRAGAFYVVYCPCEAKRFDQCATLNALQKDGAKRCGANVGGGGRVW